MNFSDLLADLDGSIEDHLCDDALYSPGEGEPVRVRIMIEYPRPADRLNGMSFTRSRPIMKVRRSACPDLVEGHRFQLVLAGGVLGDIYDAAEAPVADADGCWWAFEVQPG